MNKKALILVVLFTFSAMAINAQYRLRTVAEWEPALGTLIRWPLGIPADLVVELAKDDVLFVLVKNATQQQSATTTFESWNVNMANCRFIFAETYSHWTRDWGPHFVFDTIGNIGIADPIFNGYPWVPGCNVNAQQAEKIYSNRSGNQRGYELDDAVNASLADYFELPLIELPVYLTGGNFMTDGFRDAFSTRQMINENLPGCDEECFRAATGELMGMTNFNIVDDPEINGIQHIDCVAKLLNEETILVKQVPEWHPEFGCIEHLVWELTQLTNAWGRPYNILRILCGSYNGTSVAAYTNSLILNKKVLVPLFNISTDQQALATFQEAMPGYQVMGFQGPWYYYDALHCRTMGIFNPDMIRIAHRPMDSEVQISTNLAIDAQITDHSKAGLDPELLQLKWRTQGQSLWSTSLFMPVAGLDEYSAILPVYDPEVIVEYYITATDSTGRNERLPRTAPGGFYSFATIDTLTTSVTSKIPEIQNEAFAIYPTAFNDMVNIRIELENAGQVKIDLINSTGQTLMVFVDQWLQKGHHQFAFSTDEIKSGVCIFRMQTNNSATVKKGFKTK
jgi:agmatine deiminase